MLYCGKCMKTTLNRVFGKINYSCLLPHLLNYTSYPAVILLIPVKTTATHSTPPPPSAHLSLIHISISSLLFLAGGHYRGEGLPTDKALSLFPWHRRDETDPVTAAILFLSLLLLVTHCAPVSPAQRALSTIFCNVRQQRKTQRIMCVKVCQGKLTLVTCYRLPGLTIPEPAAKTFVFVSKSPVNFQDWEQMSFVATWSCQSVKSPFEAVRKKPHRSTKQDCVINHKARSYTAGFSAHISVTC